MKKEPKYFQGQSIILEDNSVIILKERWDTKIVRKIHQTDEVSWSAYRPEKPNDIFMVKESEIPNQVRD